MNPLVLRMVMIFVAAVAAFAMGALAIHRMRKSLNEEAESISQSPLTAEGLPIHTYHAVIQQLKQQKHELTAQQQEERRKAKASDALSAVVLANLSCGVLFFNASGLLRQANPAARELLGFASPIGMRTADLFRGATVRPDGNAQEGAVAGLEDALSPALTGKSVIHGLGLDFVAPDGTQRVLELTVSPVLGEDARLLGTTFVVTDKTEIARIREDQEARQELSAEMALGLRNSLTTMAGYAQQLARSHDAELARQLADDIANEAAQLDRTLGSFLAGARAAAAGSPAGS